MESVKSKSQFYARLHRGEFGNTSPHWDTYEEYLQSGYPDLIAIRSRVAGKRCDYFIPRDEVGQRLQSFLADGYSLSQLHFSAQCPEKDKLVQGEVRLTERGLYLFGSTNHALAMRDALKYDSFSLFGFKAHCLLKSCMCPNSWEWLNYLLKEYDDHVIEFTTLRYCWGTIPGFNTLIWEVRNY